MKQVLRQNNVKVFHLFHLVVKFTPITRVRSNREGESSSLSRGARGEWPCPPPRPVKISHKKDGRLWQPHRFHVSRPPPYPAAGSATGEGVYLYIPGACTFPIRTQNLFNFSVFQNFSGILVPPLTTYIECER